MDRTIRGSAFGVFRYFTRHRTAANLLLVIMLAIGLYATPRMHAQFFPDIVVDNVTVTVAWPGAGAADVDAAIVQVVEPGLMAVEGVASTSSRASEGRATITLEFEPGWDTERGEADVQSALDLLTTLPEDAEEPRIRRSNWRDRVTNVVITGPVAVEQLARFADEFVARLFDRGITRTTIQGIATPQISVEVPALRLVQYDLTIEAIARSIDAAISADPSGDVAGGAQRVRTGAERRSAEEIAGIVLRSSADGTVLTLGDIATVQTESIDRERAYFVGENQAITLRVDRSSSGDAIAMQAAVQDVADEMNLSLPAGVRVELVSTRAELISGRLAILLENAAQGLVLVLVILFLFLNARTALWVAAGIPVSLLTAIAVMYWAGMSFNMISLFALIITLGIVVDDAIVVGEHADFRYRTLGESPAQAAENAATRMAMPVFAASITTIAAFGGLTVIGGRFGDMIADIPWTVIAVLLASLLECFLILPNHMYHALEGASRQRWYDWPSRMVNIGFDWMRHRLFHPFMGLIVMARYPVLAGAILALTWAGTAFVRGDVQWRFFSSPEQGSLTANFLMAPDATRADTMAMMRELQRAANALATRLQAEHGEWPMTSVVAEVGGNAGRALAGASNRSADQLGSLSIDLINADSRPYSSFEFTTMLQDEVQQHALLEELSFRTFGMGPGGDSLSIDIVGPDPETLKAAAEALKGLLAPFELITGLEDTLAYDKEELVLTLTPQGQALGFATDTLARELRLRLSGLEAAVYPDGVRSASVRISLPEHERAADFLDSTLLRSTTGRYVPLGDIVHVETRQGFSAIQRENGLQLVTVSGVLDDEDAEAARAVQLRIADEILPRLQEDFGVTTRLSGLSEQESEFLADARMGVIACLVIIYLTLAWVFSSWMRPIVVMSVIPFGLIGVIYGHMAWGVPLSMFSIVGIIGMAGIIINDSIVLVSTVDDYARDRGLIPSIADAAADRLRPVLLTTATTLMGLGPLLFERSNDAQFLRPTVLTLVYGLGFGLFLVLLIVPSLLAVGHDFGRMIQSLRRSIWLRRAGVGAGLRVLPGLALAVIAGLFVATLGWPLVTGTDGPLVRWLMPGADGSLMAALTVYAPSVAVAIALTWIVGALMVWRGRPAAKQAPTPEVDATPS
ncbi:MAG: efflux RND transporter permease subunit [Paracoccaceae bacterium]